MQKIKIPYELQKMNSLFEAAGYEAYLVGGAVRDEIMGKGAHDWDVATVGPRGFTIENTITACSVSQDFTDAPEGAGVLTFTGTKAFTLSSTNTTVSTVAVSGKEASVKSRLLETVRRA